VRTASSIGAAPPAGRHLPTDGAAGPHAPPSPLRENFAWTFAGNTVYAGCQWAIVVVIAKLASPEAVGTFALGAAITAPVFLFAGLHLRASQVTDAARRFAFAEYRAVRVAGMAVALAAVVAIAALSSYDAPTRLVVLAVGASKAIEGMSDLYYGVLQQHERMRAIAVSLLWRGPLAVLAVAAALWAGGGLLLAVTALAASWAVVLLVHDRRAAAPFLRASPLRRPVDRRAAARIVAVCLPLGLVMMLVSLRTNIPRYFIQDRAGPGELGIFAALSSLLIAGNLVIGALGQAAIPRLARYSHEGDLRAFRRLLAFLLAVAVLLGGAGLLVAAFAGAPLLRALFGARYAGRSDVLVALMAVGLLSYAASFLGYGLTAMRRFTVQLPLFAGSTLACTGACLWLVPAQGLMGGAWAWGASLLIELVATAVVLKLALRRRAAGGVP